MKRLLIPIAALALLAAPAHAYPTREYDGGCGYDTVSEEPLSAGRVRYTGGMYVAVVATDSLGVPLPAARISVDCEVYVNGVPTGSGLSASGIGAAAAGRTYSFEAAAEDWVDLCERVVVDGEEIFRCDDYDPIPPQEVYDLVDEGFDVVADTLVSACAVLYSVTPGVPGCAPHEEN